MIPFEKVLAQFIAFGHPMGDAEVVYRGSPVDVRKYPGGEPLISEIPGFTGIVRHDLIVRPKTFETFVAAMAFVHALQERGLPTPGLILPQIPGARQDRINDKGDVLFTAKYVAELINAREFPYVTVLDPHSDVGPALINRCHVVHPAFNSELWGAPAYMGVIAPDAGAEKRALRFAKENKLPLYHGWKQRDVATGNLTGFGVQDLERGHYLIVDDLCDGGGTFIGLAGVLRKMRCTADLYVTHGLFTKGTSALTQVFNQVITTDSTPGPKEGVKVLHCTSTL